jgi:hypothetical protein
MPWTAAMGSVTMPCRGIPAGISGTGGRFQMIHGENEQQDFSNGLKIITATEAAFSPLRMRRGEIFSPSQVCVGGNSRKSSVTIRRSIITKTGYEKINVSVLFFNLSFSDI